jgi:hypothetical protein
MTTTVTIERQVHFQTQARGRKELKVGPEPPRPAPDPGRVPRVARLMAVRVHGSQVRLAPLWGVD